MRYRVRQRETFELVPIQWPMHLGTVLKNVSTLVVVGVETTYHRDEAEDARYWFYTVQKPNGDTVRTRGYALVDAGFQEVRGLRS